MSRRSALHVCRVRNKQHGAYGLHVRTAVATRQAGLRSRARACAGAGALGAVYGSSCIKTIVVGMAAVVPVALVAVVVVVSYRCTTVATTATTTTTSLSSPSSRGMILGWFSIPLGLAAGRRPMARLMPQWLTTTAAVARIYTFLSYITMYKWCRTYVRYVCPVGVLSVRSPNSCRAASDYSYYYIPLVYYCYSEARAHTIDPTIILLLLHTCSVIFIYTYRLYLPIGIYATPTTILLLFIVKM